VTHFPLASFSVWRIRVYFLCGWCRVAVETEIGLN